MDYDPEEPTGDEAHNGMEGLDIPLPKKSKTVDDDKLLSNVFTLPVLPGMHIPMPGEEDKDNAPRKGRRGKKKKKGQPNRERRSQTQQEIMETGPPLPDISVPPPSFPPSMQPPQWAGGAPPYFPPPFPPDMIQPPPALPMIPPPLPATSEPAMPLLMEPFKKMAPISMQKIQFSIKSSNRLVDADSEVIDDDIEDKVADALSKQRLQLDRSNDSADADGQRGTGANEKMDKSGSTTRLSVLVDPHKIPNLEAQAVNKEGNIFISSKVDAEKNVRDFLMKAPAKSKLQLPTPDSAALVPRALMKVDQPADDAQARYDDDGDISPRKPTELDEISRKVQAVAKEIAQKVDRRPYRDRRSGSPRRHRRDSRDDRRDYYDRNRYDSRSRGRYSGHYDRRDRYRRHSRSRSTGRGSRNRKSRSLSPRRESRKDESLVKAEVGLELVPYDSEKENGKEGKEDNQSKEVLEEKAAHSDGSSSTVSSGGKSPSPSSKKSAKKSVSASPLRDKKSNKQASKEKSEEKTVSKKKQVDELGEKKGKKKRKKEKAKKKKVRKKKKKESSSESEESSDEDDQSDSPSPSPPPKKRKKGQKKKRKKLPKQFEVSSNSSSDDEEPDQKKKSKPKKDSGKSESSSTDWGEYQKAVRAKAKKLSHRRGKKAKREESSGSSSEDEEDDKKKKKTKNGKCKPDDIRNRRRRPSTSSSEDSDDEPKSRKPKKKSQKEEESQKDKPKSNKESPKRKQDEDQSQMQEEDPSSGDDGESDYSSESISDVEIFMKKRSKFVFGKSTSITTATEQNNDKASGPVGTESENVPDSTVEMKEMSPPPPPPPLPKLPLFDMFFDEPRSSSPDNADQDESDDDVMEAAADDLYSSPKPESDVVISKPPEKIKFIIQSSTKVLPREKQTDAAKSPTGLKSEDIKPVVVETHTIGEHIEEKKVEEKSNDIAPTVRQPDKVEAPSFFREIGKSKLLVLDDDMESSEEVLRTVNDKPVSNLNLDAIVETEKTPVATQSTDDKAVTPQTEIPEEKGKEKSISPRPKKQSRSRSRDRRRSRQESHRRSSPRRRSRSRKRSGSPRRRTRSPPLRRVWSRRRSRSPERRFRGRRDRSRSRGRNLSRSRRRDRSRTPARRDRSRTPAKRDRSRTPPRRDRSRTPPRRDRSRTPSRRDRSRSRSRRGPSRRDSSLRRGRSRSASYSRRRSSRSHSRARSRSHHSGSSVSRSSTPKPEAQSTPDVQLPTTAMPNTTSVPVMDSMQMAQPMALQPQMGSVPPQMGPVPPQMGPVPPQMGPVPPQMGPVPPQMGPVPPQPQTLYPAAPPMFGQPMFGPAPPVPPMFFGPPAPFGMQPVPQMVPPLQPMPQAMPPAQMMPPPLQPGPMVPMGFPTGFPQQPQPVQRKGKRIMEQQGEEFDEYCDSYNVEMEDEDITVNEEMIEDDFYTSDKPEVPSTTSNIINISLSNESKIGEWEAVDKKEEEANQQITQRKADDEPLESDLLLEMLPEDSQPEPQTSSDNDTASKSMKSSPMKLKARWLNKATSQSQQVSPDSTFQDKDMPADAVVPVADDDKWPEFELIEDMEYLMEGRVESKATRRTRKYICECFINPDDHFKEGCGSDCINRLMLIECGSKCPCGEHCTNRQFQKKMYSPVKPVNAGVKGWGLSASAPIMKGRFIIEYIGECIPFGDMMSRSKKYLKAGQQHHYFMSLNNSEIIDATRKGNVSRFINHSCDPNCETQKWTVKGETRIGLFAIKDIADGEEITFDYKFEQFGRTLQKCYCGASTCRGVLGMRAKWLQNEEEKLDLLLEGEIVALQDLQGLRKTNDVIRYCRAMLRTEKTSQRVMMLKILRETDELGCLKLFISYHGLHIIWSWMVETTDFELRFELLKTLKFLPIVDRASLTTSKVLEQVERWSEFRETVSRDSASPEINTGKAEIAEADSASGGDGDEAKPAVDRRAENEKEIVHYAKELLEGWSTLKEIYRIPRKQLEERKQTEQELENEQPTRRKQQYGTWRRKEKIRKEEADSSSKRSSPRSQLPLLSKEERRRLFEEQVKAQDEYKRLLREQRRKAAQATFSTTSANWELLYHSFIHPMTQQSVLVDAKFCLPTVDPGQLDPSLEGFQYIGTYNMAGELNVQPAIQPKEKDNESTGLDAEDAPPPPPQITDSVLPPGWKQTKDKGGNVYYYNTVTKETQWERPIAEDDLSLVDGSSQFGDDSTLNSSEKSARDGFRKQISHLVVSILSGYKKSDCKVGRITTTEDFKHLGTDHRLPKKMSFTITHKELKHAASKNVTEVVFNDSVRHKAKVFIQKYMKKQGKVYRKPPWE